MDVAVPANLKCGHVEAAETALGATWAPLRYTYAGIDEIDAQWLAEHARDLQIIDVREPNEYVGELGHIGGARLIPLGTLAAVLHMLDQNAPTVAVCRSGGRSAQAVVILSKAGFTKAANLAGGMLGWHEQRLPVSKP
jgi:rhodanese-related sulfurtransferase